MILSRLDFAIDTSRSTIVIQRFRLSHTPPGKELPKSGVYLLTFPNGKVYVGCSASINEQACIRKRLHSYQVVSCKYQKKLFSALKKYSHNDIIVDILVISDDPSITLSAEVDFIKKYNSQNNCFGYNILPGGILNPRKLLSFIETKKRLSDKLLANKSIKENERKKKNESKVVNKDFSFAKNTGGKLSDDDMIRIMSNYQKERDARILRKKLRKESKNVN
jgi:hypothetical protein